MRPIYFVSAVLFGFVCVSAALAQDATPEATPDDFKAGDKRVDDSGIEQVWVPAGCFLMGTSEEQAAALEEIPSWARNELKGEQPQHEVCLSAGYWIDKFEVTNAAFESFVAAEGYTKPECWSEEGLKWLQRQMPNTLPLTCSGETEPDHPRVCITWYEAEAYAHWRGGRLPSEAEWEFAARGPESLIYPWGNEWDESKANVTDSESTTAVGSYPDGTSWVGAMDMAGNVMEWVNDWLDFAYYDQAVRDDPQGPENPGIQKVEKGGWWGSNPYVARAAYRHFEDPPDYQDHHIGFRVVKSD